MEQCEKYKPLIMGLIDHELTSEEAAEVQQHLTRCAECRKDYEELKASGQKIAAVSFQEPTDQVLENLWNPPYHHWIRLSGLCLVLFGWLLLVLFGMYQWFTNPSKGILVKCGVAALIIGFVILLASVIREQYLKHKMDPYKEIMR